jgi:integration host factor beta subunit
MVTTTENAAQQNVLVKSELIKNISTKFPQWPEKIIETVVNRILDYIGKVLSENHRIELRGFGSFSIRSRGSRKAYNPKTGGIIEISAKKAIHFKPGKELRKRVNNK